PQWRLIGGGYHHAGALAAFLAQCILQKIAHLAAAFPHQAQHRQIGASVARHHANQRALAPTTASENAHALPPPASEESINRPNAAAERLADRNALQRQRSRGIERAILAPVVRSQRIESLA